MLSPNIVEVNQSNFRELFERSMNEPVLFYFWAPMNQESATILSNLQSLTQQYNGAFILGTLDCQEEQAVAVQFGVQSLPTLALFINGQAVDGMSGELPIEDIKAMLARHLPSQDDMKLKEALSLIEQAQHAQALPLLLALPDELKAKGDVKLALADAFLHTHQFDAAEAELDTVLLEYKNNYYKSLIAQLALHKQAADSPEIQALEQALAKESNNLQLHHDLALQYHQVNRHEEALELLWTPIRSDLNALDGKIKALFMDILSALGQGNSVASHYRKKLYSLLY